MHLPFPHEQHGFTPQIPAFPEHDPSQPYLDLNAVVHPDDDRPNPGITLSPPAASGQEQDMQAPNELPSQLPEKVGPLAVAAAEVEQPDTRLTITDRPRDPITRVTRAALEELEAAMAQETRPSDPRAAKWWDKARLAEAMADDERLLLQTKFKPWDIIDSGLTGDKSYGSTFDRLTPPGMTLRDEIKAVAEAVAEREIVALELGGTGSQFSRNLLGIVHRTISVSLTDYRKILPNAEAVIAADEARGHSVIEGNILRQATRDDIQEKLAGVRPAIIIQRMVGGHHSMPYDTLGLGHNLAYYYELLANEGAMYNESPPALSLLLPSWVEAATQRGMDVTAAVVPHFNPYTDEKIHIARIHKIAGSPRRLPFVNQIYRS